VSSLIVRRETRECCVAAPWLELSGCALDPFANQRGFPKHIADELGPSCCRPAGAKSRVRRATVSNTDKALPVAKVDVECRARVSDTACSGLRATSDELDVLATIDGGLHDDTHVLGAVARSAPPPYLPLSRRAGVAPRGHRVSYMSNKRFEHTVRQTPIVALGDYQGIRCCWYRHNGDRRQVPRGLSLRRRTSHGEAISMPGNSFFVVRWRRCTARFDSRASLTMTAIAHNHRCRESAMPGYIITAS
jgi:hypothetical protein